MIKFLFATFLFFFIPHFSFSQNDSIKNGGMENWHTSPYTEPDNWVTLNSLADVGFPASTTKIIESHTGQFAAQLETMSNSFTNVSGILSSGTILNAGNNPDFSKNKIAFNGRPAKWKFYYKTAPSSDDTCIAFMILTHWDSVFQKTDTVAIASFRQSETINTYTLADIIFSYQLKIAPDSASIVFSSSADITNPIAGSVFIVDDITVEYDHTAVDNPLMAINNLTVYPNPIIKSCSIDFNSSENTVLTISVFDLHGHTLFEKSVDALKGKNSIALKEFSTFQNGLYFLKVNLNNQSHLFKVLKCTD